VIGGSLSLAPIREWFGSLSGYGWGPFALNPFSGAALGAFVLSLASVCWVATRFEETLKPEARGLHREPRTINPARFFQRYEFPGVRAANVITFVYLLAFSAMEFTLTFFAEHRFGYGPADNISIFVFVGVIMALVQGGLVRRIAPRLGERRMAALGLALVVPGLFLIGAAPGGHPAVMYLGLFFTALGSGLVTPATTSLVSLYTPPERQGGVLGIFRSLGSFARALGPILGALLFWGAQPAAPYLAAALLVAPTVFMALKLPEPTRSRGAGA
jgi:MFS family permease